ncbi:MAG: C10 family peptidase [Flavobacteriales bacterium]|nr:C10 family peptidase [Flavobacteriales bacterium]
MGLHAEQREQREQRGGATLMYHCGVGVDMQYSPEVSGAWVIQSHSPSTDRQCGVRLAHVLRLSVHALGVARENYAQAQWIDLLAPRLDAGRPILYDGFGDGGGTLSCTVATTTTTSSTSTGAGAEFIMATSP